VGVVLTFDEWSQSGCVDEPLDTLLPSLTLLVGGLIAYWMNVRTQCRAKIDEVFHEAIAALAISESRRKFVTGAGTVDGRLGRRGGCGQGATRTRSAGEICEFRGRCDGRNCASVCL
jgi:hypothetical protein